MLNLDKLKKSEQVTLTGVLTLKDVAGAPYSMPANNGQAQNAGISFRFFGGKFSGRLPFDVAQQLQAAVDRSESLYFSEVVFECSPTKEGHFKAGEILSLKVGKDLVYENTLSKEALTGQPGKAA